MMLKIQLCTTGINYILIYIKKEKNVFNCNKINVFTACFDPKNAALVSIKDFFQMN